MRKLGIVVFEILVPPTILAWLFLNYPEIFDASIPWLAFGWLWYLTWDLVLEKEPVKRYVGMFLQKVGHMAWLYAFVAGGALSLLYMWTINRSLNGLVAEHSHYVEAHALSPTVPAPNTPPSPSPALAAPIPQPKSPELKDDLSPFLIYEEGRLRINNGGTTNFYLWGFAYGDGVIDTNTFESLLITPGTYYWLDFSAVESTAAAKIENGADAHVPCRIFIKTDTAIKRTIRCSLWIKRNNNQFSIAPSVIDIQEGWWLKGNERGAAKP